MNMEMETYHKKMEAIKSVYADVILHTGKEAAARVMASERKALRAEKDLASSKEESLFIILRLKQLLDLKTNEAMEAQLKLSSQQRTVDELEAQLNEAEQITVDLRLELQHALQDLEKANHKQLLNEELLKVLYEQRAKDIEMVAGLFGVNASDQNLDELSTRNVDCVDHELAQETMRNRELEKQNGCTQGMRLRVLETSPLKNQPFILEDEEENDEGKCISTRPKNRSADRMNANSESATAHTSKTIRKTPLTNAIHRRKRKFRFVTPRRVTAKSCTPQIITNSTGAINITTGSNKENLHYAGKGYEDEHEDEEYGKRRMKSIHTLATSIKSPTYPPSETYPQSSLLARCNSNRGTKCGEGIKAQQSESSKELDLDASSKNEAEGSIILNNTNKRKRKKVIFDFPIETKSVEKSSSKRKSVEKKPVHVASGSSRASTCESRREVQVAHQLISLSNWWK